MNPITPLTPIQLQRLVDGELDFEETQRVLRMADEAPTAWRLIASTFVENQIWQARFAELTDAIDGEVDRQAVAHDRIPIAAKSAGLAPQMWWMALASSIALALTIGFMAGQNIPGFGIARPIRVADNDTPDIERPIVAGRDAASDRLIDSELNPAVYRMQLEDPSGNQYLDSDIPLYPVRQQQDLQRLPNPEIPESFRRQAHDSGYQIDEKIRYVSGRMNDGRQFVIPIRDYRLLPRQ